jgi:cytoskeletal protein RodZ
MSDKNSSRVSLFIAIIAIVLILGGVYLLNKSFSSSTKTAVASNASSQIKSTTASKSLAVKSDSSDTSVTAKPATIVEAPKTTSTASTSTATTTTGVTPAITTVSQANTSTKSDTPKAVEAAKPLSENEILAKFVGEGTGGLPKFEIQECGNKSSKLCVSPNKFIINNANKFDVKLTEGNKYRFAAKYNEDQNFIIFEAIQSITEVK